MANVIAASMVCFPYVIVGLAQAIIAGAHSAGRTDRDAAETIGGRIPLVFDESAMTSRKEDTRCKVCFIPGCPVFIPR